MPDDAAELDSVGEVWGGHRFEPERLEAYLKAAVPGFQGPLEVGQFHGGASNPTFLLTDAGTGGRYVMRKKPPGELGGGAHAVEREHRIMQALGPTDVPVPAMLALCEDAAVVGTAFYVMPFLSGRVFRTNHLEGLSPAERTAAYDDAARVLARLHAVNPAAAGLEGFGKPGGYFARQMSRFTRQYRAAETEAIPAMEQLIATLAARIPADDETTIVHGDYRMENLMFHPTEPRVLAVLDWELSTLGHPLADLAFFCLFHHADFMHWGSATTLDYPTSGVPTEAQFMATYLAAAGRGPIQDWPFYLAFSAFRLAAIAQGVHRRQRDGATRTLHDGRNGARDWAQLSLRLAGG